MLKKERHKERAWEIDIYIRASIKWNVSFFGPREEKKPEEIVVQVDKWKLFHL